MQTPLEALRRQCDFVSEFYHILLFTAKGFYILFNSFDSLDNNVYGPKSESESELFYSANIQHSITMVMYKKKKYLMLAWRLLLRPITGRYHRATRRNKKNGSQVVASVIMNTDLT